MDYKEIIKYNINYYMKLNGKIQNDLIHDLNISSSVISGWCTGYRTPSLKNLDMLSSYFGVSIIDFFIYNNNYSNDIDEILRIIKKLDSKYFNLLKNQAKALLDLQKNNSK